MSFDIWPPISPEDLRIKAAQVQERELSWITERTIVVCQELRHGLEDCYALLAPTDPGSTLVMSTPRNEKVKGTITRVGTRIIKGSLGLQLRMIPPQMLTLSQSYNIPIHALDDLHIRLTESIDLLGLILSGPDDDSMSPRPDAQSLSSALRLLADSITSSIALLKGPSLVEPQTSWTTESVPRAHFSPPLSPNFSFYITIQECSIVVWLRVLEPLDAPVHFGMKLGLAIGTVRRLEHDEMDTIFKYKHSGDNRSDTMRHPANHAFEPKSVSAPLSSRDYEDVHVREKVRVESADPNLISLHAKLGYLGVMLGQARRNLAAVMGVELEM
ncbi:hypothetical protein PT974_09573 [Cladobotryum mycophilum]|uniref:37S ribosomal protein rsm22 n=1 Tax=Cladobotryum mycophilum TaxID=491253 RepID=A0ABR0SGL1_9HYPO